MELALAKHQAQWDSKLHLSISVDSGHMYLERDGALLRDMRVSIAADRVPSVNHRDTAVTVSLGQRTIVDSRHERHAAAPAQWRNAHLRQ